MSVRSLADAPKKALKHTHSAALRMHHYMRSRRVRKVSTVLAEFVSDGGIIPREAFFDTSPSKAHPPDDADSVDEELAEILDAEPASCSNMRGLSDGPSKAAETDAKGKQRKKYSMLICMSCDVRFKDDISQT